MYRIGGAVPIRFLGAVFEQPNVLCIKILVSGVSDLYFILDALLTVASSIWLRLFIRSFPPIPPLCFFFLFGCQVLGVAEVDRFGSAVGKGLM